jgi:hypothetical protein
MKKFILTSILITSLLSFNLALAKNGADDGGGSSSSSSGGSSSGGSSNSSSGGSSSNSSSASSNSGLETETEHGVTFLKPHGGSNDVSVGSSNSSSDGMEVETEHGITFLKPHNGSSNSASQVLGLNSEGMELETEHGVSFLKAHNSNRSSSLEKKLAGRIVLQVQANGEAWFIDSVTNSRILLGKPDDAFKVMKALGVGISNKDLNKIPVSGEDKATSSLAKRLAGRILIQTQGKGEAWYVNPVTLQRVFLGRPSDAFLVMKNLGSGISNDDLNKIRVKLGEVGMRKLSIALIANGSSTQNGIAQIKELNGKVKVEIRLAGAAIGSVQPAHVHIGNTPNLGAVKYPLSDVKNGNSETILNVSFDQLLSERPLGINVHKSATEMNISVASGNL